jgi:hypothetical protein
MSKRLLPMLAVLAFMLAACSSAATETVTAEPTVPPTEVDQYVPVAESTAETEPEPASTGLVSECTLVSSLPDTPPEYAALFALKDSDWIVGPEGAAVTIIEYSDFQ